MKDDRWRRLSSLFAAALERDPAERATFVRAAAEPDVVREVESLLAAHDASGAVDRLAGRMDGLRNDALCSTTHPGGTASGTAPDTPPSLEPGQRLGRHEVRARLGAGGMGEVYRAFDTRLKREVAIKVMGGGLRHRPGTLHRFEQEARAASALNHPNIITLYDIGEESSFPYIVMELVEGVSLRQLLSERPWPFERLLHLAVQIADGLVAAHEQQIVHADLKPENILVSRRGIAKILDFGLARFQLADDTGDPGPEPARPRRQGPLGTPGYLAPEIVAGEAADARSDQFSLGAILYEMGTGTRAFAGATSTERLARTLSVEPVPLAQARPGLPAPFLRAVERCLRKRRDERYPVTRSLLDELRAARRELRPARPGAPRSPSTLPASNTRLIGREREMAEIERLIAEEGVRLLTLTGPGGTGKTRLALRAAEVLAPRFEGGVFFVALAPIQEAAVVAATLAQAIGVAALPGRSSMHAVIAELRTARAPTLLLLDSFEQVIDAVPVVSELLAACPDLAVIVTSREVLRLYGERAFPVSTLELPDPARLPPPEALARCPAVALFVERAQAANPEFRICEANAAAVAELCTGLDGLPLALELAAAQVGVLPPDAMLSRLDRRLALLTGGARDLPSRQQTLRRTVDWSHQLLNAKERAVFRRLAVFVGGFTLEAAQSVADPFGNLDMRLEEGVAALVGKSLLQAREHLEGEHRFVMLETLREYALEKLAESGEEDATRRAHAAYFLVLAEEGAVALSSGEPPWLKRLNADHGNLRAALEWLTRRGEAEWGLRLGLALFHFWERGEHLAEGRRRLGELLELDATQAHPSQRAKVMFAASVLAFVQDDSDDGVALTLRALHIYRELGDRWGVVVVLVALGNHYAGLGEYERARRILEESLLVWDELGDRIGFARSLSNLAFVAGRQGRFDEARSLYRKAAAAFEREGEHVSCAWAANHEGDVARDQGDPAAAESLYEAGLAAFRSLEDGWGIASSLADLGTMARQRGDLETASRFYRDALAGFVRLDHGRGIARQLEYLAVLAAEQDQPERGLKLAAAAAAMRESIGAPAPGSVRGELERSLAVMQARLGPTAARGAWQEGAALSPEEAARLAATGR